MCRNVSLPPGAGGRPAVWLHPQAAQPPGCGEHRARHLCPPRSGLKEVGEQGKGQRPPSLHWALQAALPVVCGAWGWASVGPRATVMAAASGGLGSYPLPTHGPPQGFYQAGGWAKCWARPDSRSRACRGPMPASPPALLASTSLSSAGWRDTGAAYRSVGQIARVRMWGPGGPVGTIREGAFQTL